jgi:sporulation and spore germination protein
MTTRQANVLTAVGLSALLATVALTAPRWSALLRSSSGPVEPEDAGPPEAGGGPDGAAAPARRINVRLYFEATERDGLLPEEREIALSSDLAQQIRTVVEELAKGPSTQGLQATLPAGTKVQEVFVQAHGVACLSLSADLARGLPGGSRAELLTVYSIVDTVVTNFPAVSRVQLVVGDQLASSLGGHVDLTRPLPADMTLVALEPAPAATPAPAAAPSVPSATPPAAH